MAAVSLLRLLRHYSDAISYIQTHNESFARTQALIRLFLYIGVIGASLAWSSFARIELVLVLFGLSLILLAVLIFVLGKRDSTLGWKETISGSVVQDKDQVPEAAEGDIRSLKIGLLADSYGLSAREKEVYELLINGRDSV